MLGSRAASASNAPLSCHSRSRPAGLGREQQQGEVDRAEQQHRIGHIMLEQPDHRWPAWRAEGSVSFSDMARSVGEIDKVSVKTGLAAGFRAEGVLMPGVFASTAKGLAAGLLRILDFLNIVSLRAGPGGSEGIGASRRASR